VSVEATSIPQVKWVVFVAIRTIETSERPTADGLKMWDDLPSRFQRMNSLPKAPIATIRNW